MNPDTPPTSHPQNATRTRRPPGVSLAIAACAILFGILPLMEVYFLQRIAASAEEAFLIGGLEISTWTWLEAIFGAVVLIVCIFAWWGRPPQIRYILMAVILFPTIANLLRIVQAMTTDNDPIFGGQGQSAIRSLLNCQLPGLIIVPLYVVWYLNRAPARAFFRGVPRQPNK